MPAGVQIEIRVSASDVDGDIVSVTLSDEDYELYRQQNENTNSGQFVLQFR